MFTSDFSSMSLSAPVLRALEQLQFTAPTQIQSEAIGPLLNGRDLMAQAPTGTGKTAAFGIPMIQSIDVQTLTLQALVLCPTRELCMQITRTLKALCQYVDGLRVVALYGGQPIERQIFALKKKPQIIVATPGRIMDHLRRKTVKLTTLHIAVLDEADEMLNMGFLDDILSILSKTPQKRQTALFSATLSPQIQQVAQQVLFDPIRVRVEAPQRRTPQITQYFVQLKKLDKRAALVRILREKRYRLCLVFCNTRKLVDQLAAQLSQLGFSVEGLHGDMPQKHRDEVMRAYRNGRIRILVATDVAARGIDVDGVQAVFNYDLPHENESYVHRIGRTGRMEHTGVSFAFVYAREKERLRQIMDFTGVRMQPYVFTSPADSVADLPPVAASPSLTRKPPRKHSEAPQRNTSGRASMHNGASDRPQARPHSTRSAQKRKPAPRRHTD